MKKTIFLLILVICNITIAQNNDIPIREQIRRLNEQRTRLAKIHKEKGKEVSSIYKIKENCEEINKQAKEILITNVKTIAGKGFLDLMTSIGISINPWAAACQAGLKLWEQFVAEPILSDVGIDYYNKDFSVRGIRYNMEQVIKKDHDLFNDIYLLDILKNYNLDYFRQDNRILPDKYPRLKPFWGGINMNNDKDFWGNTDYIEPGFRKTNIYIKISKDAINSALNLINKIAGDRRKLNDMIQTIDRKILELGGQLDTWDYTPDAAPNNLEQPKITSRTNQASSNNDAYKYQECINPRTGEGPRSPEERSKRTELLKMYYENGYRFDTYLKVNFLDEVTLGQKIPLENYAINFANPHIQNPEGVYRYSYECFVDGVKSSNYPFTELTNMKSGTPGKHFVTIVLKSCDDIIQEYEHEVIVKNPIFDATIYFKDPKSEVNQGSAYALSFNPEIDHPSIEDAEIKLENYTCYVYFDDDHVTEMKKKSLIFDPLGHYRPDQKLLTPGKHEIRIQLWDDHTDSFVDQYLHHLTITEGGGTPYIPPQVQIPATDTKNYGQIKEETYDPDLEGKRVPVLRLQWANYDYVFGNGKVKIDGFYYWNNQKVMYTSEPILNYTKGATNVPGMVLTNTSGYHIYPTTPSPGNPCSNFIITQMKGAEITILHRIKACDFNMKINADKTISISYRSSQAGQIETITLL